MHGTKVRYPSDHENVVKTSNLVSVGYGQIIYLIKRLVSEKQYLILKGSLWVCVCLSVCLCVRLSVCRQFSKML